MSSGKTIETTPSSDRAHAVSCGMSPGSIDLDRNCDSATSRARAHARPRKSPHKLQMRPAQFHQRTFTRKRNLPRERETFAGMNKLSCVVGIGLRDEIGEARGDMDEGPPLLRKLAALGARHARRLPSLSRTPTRRSDGS